MRLLAQLCMWYYLYILLGVDKIAPVEFYGVPRQFVSLLDPDIFIFVYMLTLISDTRCLHQYVQSGVLTRSSHLIVQYSYAQRPPRTSSRINSTKKKNRSRRERTKRRVEDERSGR